MTVDLIKFASISGEMAKNLWGRTDFEKYDSAWARAKNWLVDYRGGLYTRAGFEFADIIKWTPGHAIKFIEFQYSPDTANTYLCVFTDDKVRFVQDNAYVLEAAKTVASVANGTGNKLVLTSNSHGFADGDLVKLSGFTHATLLFLNGMTVEVANKTANTFDIKSLITGSLITKASITTSAGSASRIYTIASPYGQEHLERLQAVQIRDYVRLTHPDFPIYNLIRNAATSWSITAESIGISVTRPTSLAQLNKSGDDNDCHVYQVTAVNADGEESVPSIVCCIDGPNITTQDNKHIILSWTAVTGAIKYNIYRSRAVSDAGSPPDRQQSDMSVGYIGSCNSVRFTDPGITPDFTRTPPVNRNPFANGAIEYVSVTTAGTGYAYNSTITWPSGGSGAYGFLVCQVGGTSPILGLKVLDGGKDYTGTSITAATGSSAVMTATLSPATGNNPHCCAIWQQRMIYAATDNNPLRIFGSRPGFLSNFSYTDIVADDDAYEFDLDAEKVSPIRHIIPMRGGLLIFNEIGVWLLFGRDGKGVSSNNAQADPQNAVGAGYVRPVFVDSYIAYATSTGQEIQLLVYDDYTKVFGNQNISLLANHLFKPSNPITRMTFAPHPSKVVYAVQQSGKMVSMTIDIANNVYGATPHFTRGYFRDCLAITEDGQSRLYCAVERQIGNYQVMYIERLADRSFKKGRFRNIEDSFCVDAGVASTRTYPVGTLVPSSKTGSVTFDIGFSTGTPFVVGDVGKILRCGSGRAVITGYTSNTRITGTWQRDLAEDEVFPESTSPMHFGQGEWSLDSPATTYYGLWHLEGETVTALVDGVPTSGLTVSDSSVTVSACTRLAVGYPFTCIAQTLPPTTTDVPIEGRRKNTAGVGVRLFETGSLKLGMSLSKLYSISDREQRLFSLETSLKDKMVVEALPSNATYDMQVYVVQDEPLPAAILNIITDMTLGDGKGDVRGDDS